MDGFLSKPVDERLLYDQIEKTIAQHLSRGRPLRPTDAVRLAAERAESLDQQFGVAPAAGDGPPCDPSAVQIMPLAGLSHKHMQRITQAFLDEAPRRLETARAAVAAGNASTAAAAIHALKGSAGYLSSTHLHTLCHEMEAAAAAGMLAEAGDMLPNIEAALDKACADLRSAADAAARPTSATA
jgi:HPt (histidine-containing phosphotransfer) domain-containing protein